MGKLLITPDLVHYKDKSSLCYFLMKFNQTGHRTSLM